VGVCVSRVLVYGKRFGGALRASTSSSLDSTADEEWFVSGERSNGDCVSNLFDIYTYIYIVVHPRRLESESWRRVFV
jgi:hypothetical protein